MRRGICLFLFLAVVAAGSAGARNLDGTLGLIQRPISTVPVMVKAGEAFDLTVAAVPEEMRVALYRAAEEVLLLNHTREQGALPPAVGGLVTVRVTVPADTPPGLYGLAVRVQPGRVSDTAERAVKVVADWPQTYTFAHVTDTHIGRQDPPLVEQMLGRTAALINRQGVDFVLVTGDITDNGRPEQYRSFLQLLDSFQAPTFVTPGNHDRGSGEVGAYGANTIYESYCGPANYGFKVGQHCYLSLDTRWADEFLPHPPFRAWLEAQLKAPLPKLGVIFSHRVADTDLPYYQEQLPAHNYGLYVYGHTHDDNIKWVGPKRLMLLNTSHEFAGTFSVVTVAGDQVVVVDHYHRTGVN